MELVAQYLANPTTEAWKKFESSYLRSLERRCEADPAPFDDLADLATAQNVYLIPIFFSGRRNYRATTVCASFSSNKPLMNAN